MINLFCLGMVELLKTSVEEHNAKIIIISGTKHFSTLNIDFNRELTKGERFYSINPINNNIGCRDVFCLFIICHSSS